MEADMGEPHPPLRTLMVAVSGMSCVNCEILIERKFKNIAGVERAKVDHARGYAEISHAGDLDIATLQRAVAEDGYAVSPWTPSRATGRDKNSTRDYAEIIGIFAILLGILFALQHFDLLPHGLAVSDTMGYGLVF